jgi:regulator of replication initiation timing
VREYAKEFGEVVTENEDIRSDLERHIAICTDLATENERLRTALRAVRASTDPRWQAQIISDALRETP